MNIEEIKAWVKEQPEAKDFDAEQIDHIAHGLRRLLEWYENRKVAMGSFLTAVLENDFIEATTRADKTNTKALPIYAKFLYNMMPMDYKKVLPVQIVKFDHDTPMKAVFWSRDVKGRLNRRVILTKEQDGRVSIEPSFQGSLTKEEMDFVQIVFEELGDL